MIPHARRGGIKAVLVIALAIFAGAFFYNVTTAGSVATSFGIATGNTLEGLVGAVLVPGARAPVVVSEEMVSEMRPGSVVVDISIDQGGCIATAHETTHSNPVYEAHGVLHYAVGNIPGAVPNTATYALTNATLPYVVALADGVREAVLGHPELLGGINVAGGAVTNGAVAKFLGVDLVSAAEAVGI